MEDMNILSQLIKTTAQVPLKSNEYERQYIELHEPQAVHSEVKIFSPPSDSLTIKVDVFSSPGKIFGGTKGENKRADYVIISAEKKCIIYIEIKSAKADNWEHIVQQLKGAQCFMKYCQEIGKSFWGGKNFLDDYQHRFIFIGHAANLPKQNTRIEKSSKEHNTPEQAMKIYSPHRLQFNRLKGK